MWGSPTTTVVTMTLVQARTLPQEIWHAFQMLLDHSPTILYVSLILTTVFFALAIPLYIVLYFFAPAPRPATKSEKQYITVLENGALSPKLPLPCWHDSHIALKEMARKKSILPAEAFQIGEGEVFMSLVIPAYNEQDRLIGMLDEAVEYLEKQYGHHGTPSRSSTNGALQAHGFQGDPRRGWEIILVDDGSRDKTVAVALEFARRHILRSRLAAAGQAVTNGAPAGAIRAVSLERNRGKGGAVTHGMRHARGTYVVFADADGASKFSDLGKLVQGCERGKDKLGRAVGIGSRAHMVGTAAVVKRSLLRNTLMRAFHLCIWLLTTPKVAKVKDTQCGFKLFSRPALPYIVPYMHSEGWIFDVEMLMLAESAQIPMIEVPVGWKEVGGSKLNVVKDSIGMAVGLALLRVAWGAGIYRRD